MELMAAISERTKNKTAPLLAAGRYPSLTSSISFEVTSASFNFSKTCNMEAYINLAHWFGYVNWHLPQKLLTWFPRVSVPVQHCPTCFQLRLPAHGAVYPQET